MSRPNTANTNPFDVLSRDPAKQRAATAALTPTVAVHSGSNAARNKKQKAPKREAAPAVHTPPTLHVSFNEDAVDINKKSEHHEPRVESLPTKGALKKNSATEAAPIVAITTRDSAQAERKSEAAPEAAKPAETENKASAPAKAQPVTFIEPPKSQYAPPTDAVRKSLPSVDSYIRQLEINAQSIPNRKRNITDWTRFLRDDPRNPFYIAVDHNGEALTFRQVFHRTKALGTIIEGIIRNPPDNGSDFVKFFGQCLDGDSTYHAKLYDSLVHVSGRLRAFNFPKLFVKSVVSAVLSLRFNTPEYHRISYTVKTYNDVITQREEHLKTIKGNDVAEDLQRKTAFTSRLIRLADEKFQAASSYSATITDSRQVETVLHSTKTELDDLVSSLEDAETNGPAQKKKISLQREQVAKLKSDSIAEMKKKQRDLTTKEKQLIDRRRELEEEIAMINAELQRVASDRETHTAQERELAQSFDQSIQDLLTEEDSFDANVQQRKKELEVLPDVNGLIQTLFTEALLLSQKRTSFVDKATKESIALYLTYVQVHLLSQQERKTMLAQRMKLCSTKLSSLIAEAEDLKRSGMMDIAEELTKGVEKMDRLLKDYTAQYQELNADVESVRKDYQKFIESAPGDHSEHTKTVEALLKQIDAIHQ